MRFNIRVPLFTSAIFILFLMSACNGTPTFKATTPPPYISPTIIPTFPPTIEPLSPEWIPYNPDQNFDGCELYIPTIPAEDIPNEEIIQRLFQAYLGYYTSPELGGGCRLESYRIEKTQIDDRITFLAKEQNVDFVGTVLFSVQIKEVPSDWVAGNGALASGGWIIHKFLIVGVSRADDKYVLKLIGTGP